MSGKSEDRQRYESLYEEMLLRSMEIHENNKKRLRAGLITLAVVPVVLVAVRALTDSDKVVFLLLWIIFMFAICSYLIGVEYLDDSIRKTLEEVTREEVEFDDLYLRPDQMQERLHEKAKERQELLQEHFEEKQELLQNKIEARQERFAKRREKRQEFIAELRKRRAAKAEETAVDDAGNTGNPEDNTVEIDAGNASGATATNTEAGSAAANYVSKHAKREDPESGAES